MCWHKVIMHQLNSYNWVDLGTGVRKVLLKFCMAYIDCE